MSAIRLGQLLIKMRQQNFCRQTREKVGKYFSLGENYVLNTKKLFTKLDFEFLTTKYDLEKMTSKRG